jgi:hypothetical protein
MVAERYRRLPGTARHAIGSHQLWLGRGHLLLVNNTSYRETYQRVELADVHALLIARTRRTAIRAVMAALLVALLAPAPFAPDWLMALLVTVAALLLVAFVVELARGPGCRAAVRTPVHMLPLPSLRRWRTANRVLDRLRAEIEAAQGAIDVAGLASQLEELPPLPPAPPSPWTEAIAAAGAARAPYHGRLHTILGALLAVLVVLWSAHVITASLWFLWPALVTLLAVATLAVAAGIRQRDGSLPRGMHQWTWWTVAWLWSVITLAIVLTMGSLLGGLNAVTVTALSVAALGVTGLLLALWAVFERRRRVAS